MQYHLVNDPVDNTYTVLVYYCDAYYYEKSGHWQDSIEKTLTKFIGFSINPNNIVTNDDLINRIKTLAIFTPESHPEYFV